MFHCETEGGLPLLISTVFELTIKERNLPVAYVHGYESRSLEQRN